jgi:hypothetical protein
MIKDYIKEGKIVPMEVTVKVGASPGETGDELGPLSLGSGMSQADPLLSTSSCKH